MRLCLEDLKALASKIQTKKMINADFISSNPSRDRLEDLVRYVATINVINTMSEDEVNYQRRDFEDWKVFGPLASLVMPGKVSISAALVAMDLLDRKYYNGETYGLEIMSFLEFQNFTDELYGYFKKSGTDAPSIKTARQSVTLSDSLTSRTMNDNSYCAYGKYVPIKLNGLYYLPRYYNTPASEVLIDYFTEELNKLRS